MTRILIVEDSRTQAAQLEGLLVSEGFTVEIARDGRAGLERCLTQPPDVVLSDVLMPELSGFELCRKLKDSPLTRDIPVVLLTTLSDPMNIIEALASGAENYIIKPYDSARLLARVQTVIANKRLRAGRRLTTETEIVFMGKRLTISSEKEQILDLLMSSFEDIIRANQDLQASQLALEEADEQLRAHGERLARTNKELEAFVYTVSHDLKEPLRGIEAFSRFLRDDYGTAFDAQATHYLDVVRDSAERMRQLIDDLLAFSRVGRQQTLPGVVDLGAIVSDVLTSLEFSVSDAGGQVVVPPGLPNVTGYSILLRQLFANLLGNALKYRRPDVAPHITITSTSLPGGAFEVTVADNGIGVPEEFRDQVFGLFQRLHRREDYPGTGVGLSICKRIVEEHGGAIALDETPGGGCTVRFTLAGETAAQSRSSGTPSGVRPSASA